MSKKHIEEIRKLLWKDKKVYVNDLSELFAVSKVSIRKYLAALEHEGVAARFYGGASLTEAASTASDTEGIYSDPLLLSLAAAARARIADGDSIFIGSGRFCCVLARELTGYRNLSVVTNNITALPDLIRNASRVYLVGGEVTSTDSRTLFSSWETPQSLLGSIYVNKAFTSTSGIDLRAGLTVDSVISTYIFKHIPAMAHHWYLAADASKYDKIAMYPVAGLEKIGSLITDALPPRYARRLEELHVEVILAEAMPH